MINRGCGESVLLFPMTELTELKCVGSPLNPLVLPYSVCVCVWCSKSQVTVKWQHNNNSLHSPNGDTEKGFRHSSQRVGKID